MRAHHSRVVTTALPAWHESYARGLADGRRTVEAELDAERWAIAVLANSMASITEQLVLMLNPEDLTRIGEDHFDVQVVPDWTLIPGAVRAVGRLS